VRRHLFPILLGLCLLATILPLWVTGHLPAVDAPQHLFLIHVLGNLDDPSLPYAQIYEARPGLRLDDDMTRAIQKLARIDKLTRSLPGVNCGLCGAPTCAALAEDIVLGRADADACVRQRPSTTPPARGDMEPGNSARSQGQQS